MDLSDKRRLNNKVERKGIAIGRKIGYICLSFAVLVISVFLLHQLFNSQSDKKQKNNTAGYGTVLSTFELEKKDAKEKPSEQKVAEDIERPVIKAIKFIPEQPTILDNIKAEVSVAYSELDKVAYEYLWDINGKVVEDVKGDILPAGFFKKLDKIAVTVTPYVDRVKGYSYKSMFIVVHSAPPSLELKETVQKISDTVEFQLINRDPDGDKVTFSLEKPYPEGMTINKETGRIIWKPQKKEKGIYKFRASATDTDGTKITKTFEFKID